MRWGYAVKRCLAIDFESTWGREIKLGFSCQTNEEYLRDPRFKAWGLCWQEFDFDAEPWQPGQKIERRAVWVRGKDVQRWVDSVDWDSTAVVAHNSLFDVSVLSWHYGAKPAFVLDTLSMARARFGVEAGNSLAALAERFNLPPKGTELASSENLLDELPFNIEQGLADYCRHDTWLLIEIFKRLREGYPVSELRLIDMTLKMYTQACLRLDGTLLQDAIEEERVAREGLLQRLGIDEAALASNDRFADVLRGLGVEPPTKISKKTKQPTFAFAKTDAMFQALLNGDREDIALLCEARMKVKSTMARTRAQRFFDISQRGPLPVPLSYYGASTGRWTAAKGSAINMQNLKRGSFLRDAVMAPEGHVLVVGDLSQIEPRVLAWLSDYDDLLDIFRSGGDPYAQFGAQMFQIPGMTKDSHPVERQSSKSALLGAGYGLGWSAFAAQLLTGFLGAPPLRYNKQDAKKLGVDAAYIQKFLSWDENIVRMRAIPHSCTEEELLVHCLAAKAIIDRYRGAAIPVTDLWELLKQLIEYSLYSGKEYTHKCLLFRKEEIVLPNGMSIRYPDLKPELDAKGRVQWTYNSGKKRDKLYAGKVTNNITQATARIIMTDGVLRTSRRYFVAGTVHDEQIAVVPEVEATEALPWVIAQMTKPPSFMPDIPLAADGGFHSRYGKAKK